MSLPRYDHIALPIYDAAATLAFYGGLLGLPLIDALRGEDWGGRPWLMMIFALGEGREIALCERRGAARPPRGETADLPHFAFAVGDHAALQAWEAKLAAAGVAMTEERHGARRSLYVEDPNGIVLEFTAPPTQAIVQPSADAAAMVRAWIGA